MRAVDADAAGDCAHAQGRLAAERMGGQRWHDIASVFFECQQDAGHVIKRIGAHVSRTIGFDQAQTTIKVDAGKNRESLIGRWILTGKILQLLVFIHPLYSCNLRDAKTTFTIVNYNRFLHCC